MSYLFDASSAFTRSATPPSASAFTACGWAKARLTNPNNIFYVADAGFTNFLGIAWVDPNFFVWGPGTANFSRLPLVNQWFFWSLSCKGTGAADGVGYFSPYGSNRFERVATLGMAATVASMWIGDKWLGLLSNTKVFDRVLTEAELREEKASWVPKAGKINLWSPMRFSHRDASGLGHDWTINGTPTALADDPPIPWDADAVQQMRVLPQRFRIPDFFLQPGPNALARLLFFGKGQQRDFVYSLPSTSIQYQQTLPDATLSFTGSQTKQAGKQTAGSLSFIGNVSKRASRGLVAALSFVGAAAKGTGRAVSGALSFVGSLVGSHLVIVALTAALSFVGAIGRRTSRALTAALSFAGVLQRAMARALAGGLTFVGAFAKQTRRALTSAASFAGALVTGSVFNRALTAALSFTGSFSKRTSRAQTAALSFVGASSRAIARVLPAALSFSGIVAKQARRAAAASLTFAGAILTGSVFNRALTASLSFVGALTPKSILTKVLTATLSFAGTFSKRTGKAVSGSLGFSGTIGKRIGRAFAAVLAFVADLVGFGGTGQPHAPAGYPRNFSVPAEMRQFGVGAEQRRFTVVPPTMLRVPVEYRRFTVPAETRRFKVAA
jgi:hypothetical protein